MPGLPWPSRHIVPCMGRSFIHARHVPRYLASRSRRLARRSTRGLVRSCRRCVATAHLSALAPDRPGRLKILAALPLLAIARATGRPTELELPLEVGKRPLRVVVGDRTDLEALYEVVLEDEYELPQRFEPGVILDLGSHIGASVFALKRAYPNAAVIAVEPDARSFSRLTRNVTGFPDVTCLNVAVGREAGWQPLYRQAGESWASSLVPIGPMQRGPLVEVCAVGDILARARVLRVALVKLDIEGTEWDIFPALARLTTVELIIGEIHFTRSGRTNFASVRRALPGFGVNILRSDKYGGIIHAWRSPRSFGHVVTQG